jgi:hypothetical protein
MNINMRQAIHWAPRILCIGFALFISVFALDVFSEGYAVGELLIALFMHLIPTMVVLAVLAFAWRRPQQGGALFVAAALLWLVTSRGEAWIISGPLLVVGLLFLLDGRSHHRGGTAHPA